MDRTDCTKRESRHDRLSHRIFIDLQFLIFDHHAQECHCVVPIRGFEQRPDHAFDAAFERCQSVWMLDEADTIALVPSEQVYDFQLI